MTKQPSESRDDSERVGRRAFFRRVLWLGFDRVESAGQAVSKRLSSMGREETVEQPKTVYLRPPGALEGEAFGDACSRCGDCVRACPAQCIVLDPMMAGGLPHIVARVSPCVVCDDLSCMKACPTGVLSLVDAVTDIAMGVAKVDQSRCLRGVGGEAGAAQDGGIEPACRICIDECPLGDQAIGLDSDSLVEVRGGCVGCGVCERVCPTEPASVVVGLSHV